MAMTPPGLFHIEQADRVRRALRELKTVDVKRHGLIDTGIDRAGANAAQRNLRADAQDIAADLQTGDLLGYAGNVRHLLAIQLLRCEGRRNDRNFQNRFLALARHHENLAGRRVRFGFYASILRQDWSRPGKGHGRGGCEQQEC